MKLTITAHAKKQIRKFPKTLKLIVFTKIRKMVSESNRPFEKLEGYKNFYKARVGNYRIIFIKYPKEIEIVLVAHRKEVYKLLARI
ncbi:MAG: type II toxin-antitoxin system RelE/ParE family toxin [Candidatus Woesebacteria bacterium]|nr:type II toxin-antitoxin system RelE/ParE family toxin [Candidatus Woesebacteria bacterium]